MWTRLRLFILTATPTAILYALWLFSRRPKQKPSQKALKSSPDEQSPQIVPTIKVTDTDTSSQNDVINAKSHDEVPEADLIDSKLDSQTKVSNTTFQSTKENDCVSRAEVANSDVLMSKNDTGVAKLRSRGLDSIETTPPNANVKSDDKGAEVNSPTKVNYTTFQSERKDVVLQDDLTSDGAKPKIETRDVDVNSQTGGCNNVAYEMQGFKETKSMTETEIQQMEKCMEGVESKLMSQNIQESCLLKENCQNAKKVNQCSTLNRETLAMHSEQSLAGTSFASDISQGQRTQYEDPQACDDICVKAAQMENGISVRSSYPEFVSGGQVMENGLESLESVKSLENCYLSNAVLGSENSESGGDYVSESGSENQDKYAVAAQRQLGDGAGESPGGDAEKSRVVYQFDFPSDLCGRLIGKQGRNVLSIRDKSGADIVVKNKLTTTTFRVVVLEGTKRQVTLALRLIKSKFPESRYPNINYTQTVPEELLPPTESIMQLNLPMGVRMDVIVSRVIAANHVFVQQPSHPTFPHLELQMQMMLQCYDGESQTPYLPQPYEVGVVCVALIDGYWYRVQVISVCPEVDECDVKLVDYGGYVRVPGTALKQIRRDFTTLPFQAIECYLFGVISPSDEEDFPPESASVLVELVSGSILQAEAVAIEEDQVSYILLTKLNGSQSKFINRELVNRGVARWLEQ